MTAALDSYHSAYKNCSLLCEAGYDIIRDSSKDSNHESVGAIAGNHSDCCLSLGR